MPNRPLVKQPVFVPLYAGLNTELVDKLVQPANGVLEMENMVCALTGEISKRVGSANQATPTTPTLPSGGTLPTLYELAGYKDQLVRLSVMGPNPIWPFDQLNQAWLRPGLSNSAVSSLFRGPVSVKLSQLVEGVTVGSMPQLPTACAAGNFVLEAHEIANAAQVTGVVEAVLDALTLDTLFALPTANGVRPRCIASGNFMNTFFVDAASGSVRVHTWDTTSMTSGLPTGSHALTSNGTVNASAVLVVTAKSGTVVTVAYTDVTGVVSAVDYTPSTGASTGYALRTAAAGTFTAAAMVFVQDLGSSGELSLVTQESTNGVVVHWGFGAISGGASTATAEYVMDASFVGKGVASTQVAGVWNVAAYTTSNSATGEFVVMYDSLVTARTSVAIVYRATRVGSTVTTGVPYWHSTSIVSEFYQPGDGGTYMLTTYSNTENPTTPQNTFFVCVDGTPQPVPQATVAPQAAGGISRRISSLVNVVPLGGARLLAVPSLADVQFIGGVATQLFGVQLLQFSPLQAQDTTTSAPIEAFGCLLVPGGTLMSFDGRTYAEAVFARRPEPPLLIPIQPSSGATASIAHSSSDRVIGAPVQPLAAVAGDMAGGATSIAHDVRDRVVIVGGSARYDFFGGGLLQNMGILAASAALNQMYTGGALVVAGAGGGNDGVFAITAVSFVDYPPGVNLAVSIFVSHTSQTAIPLPGGTTATADASTSAAPRLLLQSPGAAIVTNDPTWASQIVTVKDPNPIQNPADLNTGTYTLDGTTPCGAVTLAGAPFFFLQITGTFQPETWPSGGLPTIALTLADPTTANTWTLANAAFDQTYVGSILQVTNTLNPGNSGSFLVLQVIDATHIVTSGPLGVAGGIIRNEDLGVTSAITYAVTPPGNLPVGSHSYVARYSSIDANGRKWRSPPSLPMSVITTALFPGVTAVVGNLHQTGRACTVELYRAQTDVGGAYNLVATIPNNTQATAVIFSDFSSDDQIAEQEELSSDGGVLPGTPLASVSLIGLHQGRVFVVSPEAPQSLFYSNPDNAGSGGAGDGLLFDTTNLSLDLIDVHGALTAIQSMDSALVALKGDAVYSIAGTGPDGTGQNGSYGSSLVASGVGTINPRSVLLQMASGAVPGGVWFESQATRAGFHTVTRGGTVEYTGAGVRRYTSETIVAALVYPALTQLRWYTASGRTLVLDWTSKLWSTNVGQPALSAVLFGGLPVVAPSDTFAGYVLEETPGLYEDGELAGVYTPIVQKVSSAWLSVSALKGYERWYRIQGVGEAIGAHKLTVNLYADFDDTTIIGTATGTFAAGDDWTWELLPPDGSAKLDALKVVLIGTDPNGALTGTAGFSTTGITVLIGVKAGLSKRPDTARLT